MKKWLKNMLALTAVAAALTGCGGGGSPGGSEDPKKDDTVVKPGMTGYCIIV